MELVDAGAQRLSIPLDAATRRVFDEVKGSCVGSPYDWDRQFELLTEATGFFGKGRVSTHLIVGLGETEKEMVDVIQKCVDLTVLPALFAFTPIPGTRLGKRPQPLIESYRRIQVARHLIVHRLSRYADMRFDEQDCVTGFGVTEQILKETIRVGEPFLTSGCPGCNRPYYNEKPSGPLYNFPRKPMKRELAEIERQAMMPSRLSKNLCVRRG
jgi:biotin synthase